MSEPDRGPLLALSAVVASILLLVLLGILALTIVADPIP